MALQVATHLYRDRHQKTARSATLASSALFTRQPILQLQRTLGNHAVQRLIHARMDAHVPLSIQAKVMVGPAGDKYEQEADHVANRVMAMPGPAAHHSVQRATRPEEEKEKTLQPRRLADAITPFVHRQMMPEDEEKPAQARFLAGSLSPLAQRQMVDEDKEKKPVQAKLLTDLGTTILQREMGTEKEKDKTEQPIQARLSVQQTATREGFEARYDFEARLSRGNGRGSPLPDQVRSYMEPRFGVDFRGVRVHTDHEATELNRAVGAQAFTHGQDIYFGAGKAPGITDLMAHELTHVVQQTGTNAQRSDAAGEKPQQQRQKPIQRQGGDDLEQELPPGYPDWQHGAPTKPVSPDPHVAPAPGTDPEPKQGPYRTPQVPEEDSAPSTREKIANALKKAGVPPWAAAATVTLIITGLADPEPFSKIAFLVGAAAAVAIFVSLGRQDEVPPGA